VASAELASVVLVAARAPHYCGCAEAIRQVTWEEISTCQVVT